jgi:hypothetical protein
MIVGFEAAFAPNLLIPLAMEDGLWAWLLPL